MNVRSAEHKRRGALIRTALVMFWAFAVVACPGMTEAPVQKTCSRIADKCKLDHGPLGVCTQTTCAEGQTPPCFICQPQH